MKWRALLVVLPCVLLPLPLAGLLVVAMRPSAPPSPQQTALIPLLPLDVRGSLPTYEHDCMTDEDCDPPLGCLRINSEYRSECTDSRCMEDKDCPDEFACIPVKTRKSQRLVRRCSLVGDRKEGEKCDVLARSHRLGCARGLLCQAGWCGRPCQLEDPTSCPTGFFCSEGREGPPSCLPTCEGRSCPEGQQCLPDEGGSSLCQQVVGPDCRKNSCPKDYDCRLMTPPQRPWEVRTECRQGCDRKIPCPGGTVCIRYECRRTCDPQNPSTCGPGLTCGQLNPSDPWYCLPG
jgi:hypothetical protein